MKAKKRSNATTKGRVIGMVSIGGEWRFVTQSFSTSNGDQPVVCHLATLDQLAGTPRKKAERWAAYFPKKTA